MNAISQALRQEHVQDNVRVTTIEPGVVATELAEHISEENAKSRIDCMIDRFDPLQKEGIASAIAYAVTQPDRVNVDELLIKPAKQT